MNYKNTFQHEMPNTGHPNMCLKAENRDVWAGATCDQLRAPKLKSFGGMCEATTNSEYTTGGSLIRTRMVQSVSETRLLNMFVRCACVCVCVYV